VDDTADLDALPEAVATALATETAVETVADRWADIDQCAVLGRGNDPETPRGLAKVTRTT
jgi:hypothetical protein